MLAEDLLFFSVPVAAFQRNFHLNDSVKLYFLMVTLRLIAYPIAGWMSDRRGALKTYRYSVLIRAGIALFSMIAIKNHPGIFIPILVALVFSEGVCSGFSSVSFDAQSTDENTQGAIQNADQLAVLTAPLLGAFLLKFLFISGVLLCTAIFFIAAFYLSFSLMPIAPLANRKYSSPRNFGLFFDLHLVFQAILASPFLLILIILTLIDNFLIGMQGASMTPLALGLFNRDESALGLALFLGGCAASITVWGCTRWLKPSFTRHLWVTSYLIQYLGFLLTGFSRSFIGYSTGLGICDVACAVSIYTLRVLRLTIIPQAELGKTLGIIYFLQQLTLPLGSLLVGLNETTQVLQRTILLTSAMGGIVTFILIRFLLYTFREAVIPKEAY